MKVGIACFFPWRPHVQQGKYLGDLLQDDGHAVEYLVCDGQLPNCYQKMVAKRTESSFTCAKCILGGFRTYSGGKNVRLPRVDLIPNQDAIDWCQSSASTLYRGESFEHLESEEKRSIARALEPGAQRAYASTLRWLKDSNVDALLAFNGRMDVTRTAIEAADAAGIPFVTMERPWFGDGIQLLPGEQCIGLRGINALAVEWKSKPLTHSQAFLAASLVAARVQGSNLREWRAYNTEAEPAHWPGNDSQRKVLVLPGSRNEVYGHPDWSIKEINRTDSFQSAITDMQVSPGEVVVRCHPNWRENIWGTNGRRIESFYTDWATSSGYTVISSAAKASTIELIKQADVVVVSGGSAALEAALLGVQVVSVGPSAYNGSGLADEYRFGCDKPVWDWERLDSALVEVKKARARYALRFLYVAYERATSYADFVQCITPTEYRFYQGANSQRVTQLLLGQQLLAYDDVCGTGIEAEDEVLALIRDNRWQEISAIGGRYRDTAYQGKTPIEVKRRSLFSWVDPVREMSSRGDRK